ncbi:MAG: hypothetical protein QF632_02655 [Candidatus Woesearchaeota archaeon]|jgi:hypothetical protein|nr:hypothetical protein [Candidatus Woesearchaeota archaeon]
MKLLETIVEKAKGLAKLGGIALLSATLACAPISAGGNFRTKRKSFRKTQDTEQMMKQFDYDIEHKYTEKDCEHIARRVVVDSKVYVPGHSKTEPIVDEKGKEFGQHFYSWSGGYATSIGRWDLYKVGDAKFLIHQYTVPFKTGLFSSQVDVYVDFNNDGKCDLYARGKGGSILAADALTGMSGNPNRETRDGLSDSNKARLDSFYKTNVARTIDQNVLKQKEVVGK